MSNRHVFYLLASCILFAVIFSPSPLYFLSDDWDSLLFSLHPSNILHSFRPVSDASLLFDYSIWKMNAAGFHFTNLILHFAGVFCFYHFSKLMFGLRNDNNAASKLALASSLLFLFYPFHSESVFWLVARGSILCTFFGLLCFIFFIKKDKSQWYYLISLFCFAIALLSYEEAWIIPVIISILNYLYKAERGKKNVLVLSSFWLLFFIYLAGRYYFTKNIIGTPYGSERIMNFNVLFLGKNVAAFVFRSVVIPMQSSVIFSIVCAFTALILIALFFVFRKKINLVIVVNTIFFALSLLPVLPLGIDTHDTESERFLYFPSVFFIIFFTQFFAFVFEKKIWLLYVALLAETVALWQSYNSFEISSSISRVTMASLGKTDKTDTIFCSRLPGQYKGAFIFRNGFASAVKLIKKDSAENVIIVSVSELFHPSKSYVAEWQNQASEEYKRNVHIEWKEDKVILKR